MKEKELDNDEREKRAAIVCNDYDGIIPYCESFYLHSILYSAGRCLESFERYEHFKDEEVSPEYLVSIIQEAVGHAAALSRYFWPSYQGKKKQSNLKCLKQARGEKLCDSFGLTKESPLYHRDLRNAWEHFDERLDIYLLENEAGCFFPKCTLSRHTLADDPIGHIFKLLDKDAECLVLMGYKYFFAPIREEVKHILSIALEAIENGARLERQ